MGPLQEMRAESAPERDEIRLGCDDRIFFFSYPGRSAARVLRAGGLLYFAWGCFRVFCASRAIHRRRDSMPGPGYEIASASRLPGESI
jgi:hypothetical protein